MIRRLPSLILLPGILAITTLCAAGETPLQPLEIDHRADILQRGAETVVGVCVGCHDLQYLHYRDLRSIGLSQKAVDSYRGELSLEAPLLSLMPAEQRKVMFGLVPPDLSMMARAREGGARYIYTLLTSFHTTAAGGVDNSLFPGIKMPDILASSTAEDPEAIHKTAREAAIFLDWAADPHADERHTLGYYVLTYLGVLTLLLYLLKCRIWQRLDAPENKST